MPIPFLAMAAISAAAQAFHSINQSRSERAQREELARQANMEAALKESGMNPFRAANAQSGLLSALDRETNTTQPSVSQNLVGGRSFSQVNPGSYQMSPEVLQWLTQLKQRIASGVAQNPGVTPGYRTGVTNLTQAYQNPRNTLGTAMAEKYPGTDY